MHVFLYLYLSVFEEICLLSCSTEFFFFFRFHCYWVCLMGKVTWNSVRLIKFCMSIPCYQHEISGLWTLVLLRDPSLLRVFCFHHVALQMASPKEKEKRKKDNKHSDKFALISSYFALELMREKKCKKGCLVSIYWMSTKGRWSSFQLFYRLESVFLLIAVLNRDFSLGGWWESHRMCTCL